LPAPSAGTIFQGIYVDISKETKEYFKQKSKRFSKYQDSKNVALEFITEHHITEPDLCVFLMVGSILWTSAQLQESLQEEELCQLLGIDDDIDEEDNGMYEAYEGLLDMDLDEFLLRIYLDNK